MSRLFIFAGIVLLLLVSVRGARRRRVAPVAPAVDRSNQRLNQLFQDVDTKPDSPIGLGYKNSWLAVRSERSEAVISFLAIDRLQSGNWKSGCIAAYNGGMFVTPPINGWVLVFTSKIPTPDTESDAEEWTALMKSLSEKFGESQFFGTHRIVGYNAWAQFVHGHEVRAYAFSGESGETLVDRGARTEAEIELGYRYFDSNSHESKDDSYWDREDLCYPDEDHVMALAGKWSVNPSSIGELNLPQSIGWVGLPRRPMQQLIK